MKKLLTILIGILGFILLVAYFVFLNLERPMGAEKFDLDKIQKEIECDKQDDGKYKRQDKKIIGNIEYYVHEYETSKGEIGYTIYLTKEEDNKIYKKVISTGVEKTNREYDWILIQDNIIVESTTTTTATTTSQ